MMLDFQLAKSIHEDHLREAEHKRLQHQISQEKRRQRANAAPARGRRLLLTLGPLLFFFRRGS